MGYDYTHEHYENYERVLEVIEERVDEIEDSTVQQEIRIGILKIKDPLDQSSAIHTLLTKIDFDSLGDIEKVKSFVWDIFDGCTVPASMAFSLPKHFSDEKIVEQLAKRDDDVRRNLIQNPDLYGEWSQPEILRDSRRLCQIPGVRENQTLMKMLARLFIEDVLTYVFEWDNVFTDLCTVFPFKPVFSGNTDHVRTLQLIQGTDGASLWPPDMEEVIAYLEELLEIGDWELVLLAIRSEWEVIHWFKYRSEREMENNRKPIPEGQYVTPRSELERLRELDYAIDVQQMEEYDESRNYLFQLFGVVYSPIYEFEKNQLFTKLYKSIESPKDLRDMFQQIRKYLKDTFGHLKLIDDSLE